MTGEHNCDWGEAPQQTRWNREHLCGPHPEDGKGYEMLLRVRGVNSRVNFLLNQRDLLFFGNNGPENKTPKTLTRSKGYVSIFQSTRGGEGGGGLRLLIQITFFDDFQLCMDLGWNCDVLQLLQSVQNANAPHLRPFEGPRSIQVEAWARKWWLCPDDLRSFLSGLDPD